MKIALVTHKFCKGDGQGRVNFEIAREALRQGHSLTLIATEVAAEFQGHPAVTWVPVPVRHWPTALLKGQVFAAKSARWLIAHRQDVDVVQVNGFITWAASDVNAVHFVHSAWGKSSVHTGRLRPGPYGLYQKLYTALNARLEGRAFRQTKTVVAVSERVKQELIAIGVPGQHIQVIINGVDLDEFAPGSASPTGLELLDGATLALFVGDIRTPRKNLDTTLRALVSVPDLHLIVAGATAGSPYPALCASLGLDDRVHFLGFRRDIASLMRVMDLFVFPSRYEACSLVLLEALASGLPVITAATAGGAEVITLESGIVLPDPNDVAALAAAMRTLMQSRKRRRDMSLAARAVAEQHSWSSMANAYLEICRQTQERRGNVAKCLTKLNL